MRPVREDGVVVPRVEDDHDALLRARRVADESAQIENLQPRVDGRRGQERAVLVVQRDLEGREPPVRAGIPLVNDLHAMIVAVLVERARQQRREAT